MNVSSTKILALTLLLLTACNRGPTAVEEADGEAGEGAGADGDMSTPDMLPDDLPAECDYLPSNGECSLWCQDCDSGQTCVPDIFAGATRCVEDGSSSTNESCDPDSDAPCGPGLTCWDEDPDTGLGICTELCGGEPLAAECPDGKACLQNGDMTVAVCTTDCDPRNSECGASEYCGVRRAVCGALDCFPLDASARFFCGPDAGGSDGLLGQPCEYQNGCSDLYFCAPAGLLTGCDSGSPGCCAAYCTLDGSDCTDGKTCAPLFEADAAPSGMEDLGICVDTLP